MKTSTTLQPETCLARPVAAEDLMRGDVVAVLDEIAEYPSFLWCFDSQVVPTGQPVRVQWRTTDGGQPLKVKAVCLPFVLVKLRGGRHKTLDVRQCRLVRLSRDYARRVWKTQTKRKRKRRR